MHLHYGFVQRNRHSANPSFAQRNPRVRMRVRVRVCMCVCVHVCVCVRACVQYENSDLFVRVVHYAASCRTLSLCVSHLAHNPPPSPLSLSSPSLPPFLSTHSTASVSVVSPAVGLVRKLVGVLEAIEKLPVYIHEAAGQVLNLQVHGCIYSTVHCTCVLRHFIHIHVGGWFSFSSSCSFLASILYTCISMYNVHV